MNIKSINHNTSYIKSYGDIKRINENNDTKIKKDSIEISSIAKSLSNMQGNDIKTMCDEKKVEDIKVSIREGTYNVDSKLIAKKILLSMKGR
ncbi:flagellin synthesis regulator FlgM [Clostridium putrefaciens]|uniref:Negative regulator of flagellin synthesis n=1 Tax=Clostridium putrefaciens TaxID=99675 RepID=A0A381JAN7_9CLOT|nr:flagellar biosynthesis anti-sigma factor FlgM [Clostridium putrefaciens]SUY47506.1 flagellin synthesis regulator FlgM [Clostridium putrefaciens]